MGCKGSKRDINDKYPNIFEVTNVDETYHCICPGQLEVTETELVLHQKGKVAMRWPVYGLRKYGFDGEIFTFESGRRCPSGAGIYAFRCQRAERLFNLIQHNIQLRNQNDEGLSLNTNLLSSGANFPVPITSTGPPVHRRLPSLSDGYLNPTNTVAGVRPHPCLSRPGSVTSNGPVSPSAVSPPPMPGSDVAFERNNNRQAEHSYTNTSAVSAPTYINLGIATSPTASENYVNIPDSSRLYMNIDTNTKDVPKLLAEVTPETEIEDTMHCYANVGVSDMECLRSRNPETPTALESSNTLCIPQQDINYIELDLENTKSAPVNGISLLDSPSNVKKGYATIDFDKTNALSQSVNPNSEIDEGSRKTRHNSTISDVPARHSNSSSD